MCTPPVQTHIPDCVCFLKCLFLFDTIDTTDTIDTIDTIDTTDTTDTLVTIDTIVNLVTLVTPDTHPVLHCPLPQRHFGGLDPDEPLLRGGERQQRKRPDDPTGTSPVAGRGGFRERVTHVRRVRGGPGVVVVRNGGRYVLRRQVVDFV